MDNSEILSSLNKYKNEEFKTIFLDDTINYFTNLKSNIKEITDNEILLNNIKLNLLYNKNKY